jgi:hypothetical protein
VDGVRRGSVGWHQSAVDQVTGKEPQFVEIDPLTRVKMSEGDLRRNASPTLRRSRRSSPSTWMFFTAR